MFKSTTQTIPNHHQGPKRKNEIKQIFVVFYPNVPLVEKEKGRRKFFPLIVNTFFVVS